MKQVEADVVIIAAGTAGLTAAVAAAENGASVIAFEKAATTGGAGNMAMGPFAVESRLQRLMKYALTKEEAFKIQMNYTHWLVDARLVKAFIDKSADTIDWFEKMGVEFYNVQNHNYGYYYTWHTVKLPTGVTEPGAAAHMMKILTNRAKELGVQIFLRTPAKKILKEGGRVVGVLAEDESGEEIRARARAVIIATGGFGDNPEMIKKYTGYDIAQGSVPGLVGDGIRMAWEAGAAPSEMILHRGAGVHDETQQEVFTSGWTFNQPNLMVNLSGERFMNEEIAQITPFGANPVAREKNKCAFIIFDGNIKRHYEEEGLDFLPPAVPAGESISDLSDFDDGVQKAIDRGSKSMFMADSIEELASKTGLNLDRLRQTIDDYNKACKAGHDELFYKNPKYLRPIKKPRFYAGKLMIGALGTLGGITINHKTEVLTKEHEVIPGLYAAGNDANSINGDTYIFILPGSTFGFAVNSGRIAGENATKYAKTVR